MDSESMDHVLLALADRSRERALFPSELVLKGRAIQMGSDAVVADYKEAGKAFQEALDVDPFYVPALLELGWFLYAPEDDAASALPFFDKAIEVCLDQLKEALKGKVGCLGELESEQAAADFLRQFSQQLQSLEDQAAETEEGEGEE